METIHYLPNQCRCSPASSDKTKNQRVCIASCVEHVSRVGVCDVVWLVKVEWGGWGGGGGGVGCGVARSWS